MFDEVLKRGSLIVDGLSAYKQPVFVYIVPNGELRGGAWVVLDPSINANGMMEMYVDEESRAGVLEPEGIVEIKLRKDKLLALMDRLDPTYRELKAKSTDASLSPSDAAAAKADLAAREKQLLPMYQQVALQFADAHDRAARTVSKGCARSALQWADSRRYFYNRLRRRLAEESAISRIGAANPALTREEKVAYVAQIVPADVDLTNDAAVATALEKAGADITVAVRNARATAIASQIASLAKEDGPAFLQGLTAALGDKLDAQQIASLSALLA